jgi:hypothetical protein
VLPVDRQVHALAKGACIEINLDALRADVGNTGQLLEHRLDIRGLRVVKVGAAFEGQLRDLIPSAEIIMNGMRRGKSVLDLSLELPNLFLTFLWSSIPTPSPRQRRGRQGVSAKSMAG